MPRMPAAVRSLVPHRLALTSVVVTATLSATLLATLVSFAAIVTGYAVRATLRSSPATGILVTAPVTSAPAAAADLAAVRDAVQHAAPGGPLAVTGSLGTDFLNIPAAAGGAHTQTHLISLAGPARHAVLVAGTWPRGASAGPGGAAVPVAVPAATAARLRLHPGSGLTLRSAATGQPVTVRVTGIFRRGRQAGGYWTLDPVSSAVPQKEGGFTVFPSLVTSQAALAAHRVPLNTAAWVVTLDVSRIGAGGLGSFAVALQDSLAGLTTRPGLRSAAVTTGLPALLAGLDRAVVVARSQLAVGILILLVIAGATLALAVSLLSSQREAEATLLRARGASRSQLTRTGLAEAVLLVAPAALLGPVFGGLLLPALGRRGPLAHSALHLGVAFPPVAWLASAAAAAGCALVIARAWLSAAQSPVRARAERGRQRALAAAARSGVDLALVAVAGLAGWQLAHYRAPVTTGLGGSIGVDPILVSAPVLALAAAAVLMLRLLPLVARLGDRAATHGRDLTAAVAAWQISRRPVRQAGPVLLAVLAVATSVIAFAGWSSWQRSAQDQAGFATGADVRVSLPPAAPLPLDGVTGLTRAPGVTGSTPVIRAQIGLPNSGTAQLLALDGRRAVPVAKIRPDLAGGSPASALARIAAPAQPAVPIPGRPARLQVTATVTAGTVTGSVLFVQLVDAYGAAYQLEAGVFAADGRPHTLTVPVTPRGGAAYPLRITGYTLQYTLPKKKPVTAVLTIGPVRAAAALTGPAGPAFAPARAGVRLTPVASAGEATRLGALLASPVVRHQPVAGPGGLTMRFTTGAGYGPPSRDCGTALAKYPCGPPSPVPATVAVAAGPPPPAVPALVTTAFAAAIQTHRGRTFPVIVDGTPISLRVVGVVKEFPTITGSSGGAIVGQAALQQALTAAGALPAPVTEWWLSSRGPVSLPVLPRGSTVTDRVTVAAALLASPLSAAPQLAMLAIALAAVILAAAGFLVAAATARERAHDMALLAALGATRAQLTRLLALEQAAIAVPAAAAGLILGGLLARLVIPAVSITPDGRHPQPPVIVQVPLAAPVLVALIMAAGPVLLAATGSGTRSRVVRHTRVEATT